MSLLQPLKGDDQRRHILEKQLWKHFERLSIESRRELFEEFDLSYPAFMALLKEKAAKEQDLPDREQLAVRLKNVRAHTKAPRMKKLGRLFLQRHYIEASKLLEQGASYREIAEYLKLYRKFKISPAYLRSLMESVS